MSKKTALDITEKVISTYRDDPYVFDRTLADFVIETLKESGFIVELADDFADRISQELKKDLLKEIIKEGLI